MAEEHDVAGTSTQAETEQKETARIEAFSDGVFAIAITLLVLELKVPHALPSEEGLATALLHQWPSYVAFLASFLTIGIMWINHHRLFTIIARSSHGLLLLNSLLLLGITIVPFPTALLAEHLRGSDGRTVAIIYATHGFIIALLFTALFRYAAKEGRLLGRGVDLQIVERIRRQYRFGPLLYLSSIGLAFVSVYASVAVNVVLAAFFALEPPRMMRAEAPTARA